MEGSKASGGEEATQVLADILIMFSVNSIVWWPQIKHWRGDDDSVRWHNFIKDRGLQGQLFLGSLAGISTFRCYQRKSNLSSVSHFWTKEGKNAATLKCPSRWQKAGEKERRTRSSRVVLWRRVMWSSVVDHACTCSCAFLTPLTRWRAELRTHTFVCSLGWRVADACVPAVWRCLQADVLQTPPWLAEWLPLPRENRPVALRRTPANADVTTRVQWRLAARAETSWH